MDKDQTMTIISSPCSSHYMIWYLVVRILAAVFKLVRGILPNVHIKCNGLSETLEKAGLLPVSKMVCPFNNVMVLCCWFENLSIAGGVWLEFYGGVGLLLLLLHTCGQSNQWVYLSSGSALSRRQFVPFHGVVAPGHLFDCFVLSRLVLRICLIWLPSCLGPALCVLSLQLIWFSGLLPSHHSINLAVCNRCLELTFDLDCIR